jgi:hypothetical protein
MTHITFSENAADRSLAPKASVPAGIITRQRPLSSAARTAARRAWPTPRTPLLILLMAGNEAGKFGGRSRGV